MNQLQDGVREKYGRLLVIGFWVFFESIAKLLRDLNRFQSLPVSHKYNKPFSVSLVRRTIAVSKRDIQCQRLHAYPLDRQSDRQNVFVLLQAIRSGMLRKRGASRLSCRPGDVRQSTNPACEEIRAPPVPSSDRSWRSETIPAMSVSQNSTRRGCLEGRSHVMSLEVTTLRIRYRLSAKHYCRPTLSELPKVSRLHDRERTNQNRE